MDSTRTTTLFFLVIPVVILAAPHEPGDEYCWSNDHDVLHVMARSDSICLLAPDAPILTVTMPACRAEHWEQWQTCNLWHDYVPVLVHYCGVSVPWAVTSGDARLTWTLLVLEGELGALGEGPERLVKLKPNDGSSCNTQVPLSKQWLA